MSTHVKNDKSWSRRDFIIKTAGAGASFMLASHLFPGLSLFARASERKRIVNINANGHFFVMLRATGGWDVTLGLDPYIMPAGADDQDMFIEYRPEDIITAGGLKLGPAAKPLVPHAGECAILNGVMMRRDAGHDGVRLYMTTGRGDGRAAALPVELAEGLGSGPYGVVSNGDLHLAGLTPILSSTGAVLNTARDVESAEDLAPIHDPANPDRSPLDDAIGSVVNSGPVAQKVANILKGFQTSTPQLEEQHAVAAAFAAEAAEQAQLTKGFNLDTHSGHEGAHMQVQTEVWQWVADIFKLFKNVPYRRGSLFDHTTFMVISEFARTPALNASRGKDHNPFTNSVLLAGKGIKHGTTVGASKLITRGQAQGGSSLHIAAPYDYVAGRVADSRQGASFIFPENVAHTVAKIFGMPNGMPAIDPAYPSVPGIIS